MPDFAYSRYDITINDAEWVTVHFDTNDDEDTGYPGKRASDTYEYYGKNALELALKHCGKSRQGIGHRVYVTVDGKEV